MQPQKTAWPFSCLCHGYEIPLPVCIALFITGNISSLLFLHMVINNEKQNIRKISFKQYSSLQ